MNESTNDRSDIQVYHEFGHYQVGSWWGCFLDCGNVSEEGNDQTNDRSQTIIEVLVLKEDSQVNCSQQPYGNDTCNDSVKWVLENRNIEISILEVLDILFSLSGSIVLFKCLPCFFCMSILQ